MEVAQDPFALALVRKSHKAALVLTTALGSTVLVGWSSGQEWLYTLARFGETRVPTAVALLLACCSLWFWRKPRGKYRVRFARLCGVAVALIGFYSAGAYVFDGTLDPRLRVPLGEWLTGFGAKGYRMALNTAISLCLMGGALYLLEARTRRGKRPAEWLAVCSAFVPFAALVGYIYGVRGLISPFQAPFAPAAMALQTAVGLLLVCIAILTARPERGWMARFTSRSSEGVVARKLLPAGIAALLFLGWLTESGEQVGIYGHYQGAALMVTLSALTFGMLIRKCMGALADLEAERQNAEAQLHRSEERLRLALAAARVGTWEWDFATNEVRCSEAVETLFGLSKGSFDGRGESFVQLIHPDDRELVLTRAMRAAEGVDEPDYRAEYRILRPDGAMRWISSRGEVFRDRTGRPLRIAGASIDVTERKLLERELIEASSREQRRLGQDLHDDLGQWLTGIQLEMHAFSLRLKTKSDADAAFAEKIAGYIQEAMNRTRMLARGLAPAAIEADGLAGALQELAATTERMFRTRCLCACSDALTVRNPEAALQLYRIAQEAISNAIRHGKATEVCVALEPQEDGSARLVIRDNGEGIPQPLPRSSGMGLRIMQYRAGLLGANVDIRPAHGGGTEVACRFSRNL